MAEKSRERAAGAELSLGRDDEFVVEWRIEVEILNRENGICRGSASAGYLFVLYWTLYQGRDTLMSLKLMLPSFWRYETTHRGRTTCLLQDWWFSVLQGCLKQGSPPLPKRGMHRHAPSFKSTL